MRRAAVSLKQQDLTIESFSEQAFFKVKAVPNAFWNGSEWSKSPDKKSIVREDTGEYISTVGHNYAIVDNEAFFHNTIQSLNNEGIVWKPKQVHVDGTGKRTTMIVHLPQFDLFKGSNEEQTFELRIANSFDTTMAADTILGFLRLICTNGMTAFNQEFNWRMVHKGDIHTKQRQAIELYKGFEDVWTANKELITRLGSTHGHYASISDYIGDGEFTKSKVVSGPRWAKKLLQKWQESGETTNLWELYNIFTYIISHEFGSNYGSKQARMDVLNKEVKYWDKMFNRGISVFN